MKFRRFLLSRPFRSPEPGEDGAGTATPPDAGTQGAAPDATPDDAGQSAPGNMLQAMFGQKPEQAGGEPTAEEQAEAAATGKTVQQLRDERGRFTSGKVETPPADPAKPAEAKLKEPPKDGKPELAMPEGLTPKAQERFQQLANTNRELSAKLEEMAPAAESAQALAEVFKENGVRREQFEQAMEVVGLMNRGDLRGALAALDEQRKLISLALGESLPGADPLADFPDLKQAVDNLQMTEQYALELARNRMQQNHAQQASQRQQQERQTQQQEEQAIKGGQLAVDKFCKARMADDLDYPKIEPLLLKEIQDGLLAGVPPSAWPGIVEKTYRLIKQTAQSTRQAAPATSVLRPTGGESPRQAPQSTFDAMFGAKA